MVKAIIESQFVSAKDVKTDDLVTFKGEGEIREVEFSGEKRNVLQMPIELPDGKIKTLTLNNTSKRNLTAFYGTDETAEWVGKAARVEIRNERVRKDFKDVVYLTAPNKDLAGNVINE